jgi:hypothetical protein
MSNDLFNRNSYSVVDPFNVGSGGSIKQNINHFIEKYPNWMIYIRRNLKFKCINCYDTPSLNPDSSCQECFGLGYKITFEKHKVRRVIRVQDAQSPLESFGYLSKYRTIIYSPKDYYPKSKDLYLEVEWDKSLNLIKTYGKPVNLIDTYQVDESIAFKESEVSFFGSGCGTYNFNIESMKQWLFELPSGSYTSPIITY